MSLNTHDISTLRTNTAKISYCKVIDTSYESTGQIQTNTANISYVSSSTHHMNQLKKM